MGKGRRGRRGVGERFAERGKGIYFLYSLLGILLVMIVTFVITLMVYKNKLQNSSYSGLTAEKIAELVPNETNTETEQASIDIGKSIEEVVKKAEEEAIKEQDEENINQNKEEQEPEEQSVETSVEPVQIKNPEFIMPVEGEIIRSFAKDTLIYSETLQEWITHLGIDIKAPRTTVVRAAEEGEVVAIKNDPRYGLTVVIEHTNGFKTVYSNLLTSEFVKEKDKVEKGQTIGTVGNSASFEIVDEPHLHFEILKDDQNVDPALYIK